ncbi:hypothetical protein GCM10022225_41850 [Plantactinospora mayteni]|uniref:Uncharacterized protein n=1 Tax=Plantactinospora mayteni TaxID=566021 RepID=A0ABQ4EUC5_9ACTN|nr:hypothetical protein Pma05_47820 [Plantactinospora mayteni]
MPAKPDCQAVMTVNREPAALHYRARPPSPVPVAPGNPRRSHGKVHVSLVPLGSDSGK